MDNSFEEIEDFLEGRLPKAESVALEKRIQEDEDFAERVSFYILTKNTLSQKTNNSKKEAWKDQYKANPPKKKNNVLWLGGSLAAAACALFFLFQVFYNPKVSPEQYASNYIDKNLSQLPLEMSSHQVELSKAAEQFNLGNSNEAKAILDKMPENYQVLEYKGIIALKNKQYQDAETLFKKLAGDQEVLVNKGSFYLALTYLEMGDITRAKPILETIANNPNDFGYKEAKEILASW